MSARRSQATVVGAALALGVAALVALPGHGWRMPALLVLGAFLGATLYHAAFGFTAAYRRLFVHRDVAGVRAQLVMLGAATLLFAPVLAAGEAFGRPVVGAVAPVGVQVAAGAFLFGIGMQLAGGCGSGTLFALGGGSARMVLTLAFFCAGSFWASLHMAAWATAPDYGAVSLGEALGWPAAVALQLLVLSVVGVWLGVIGRRSADRPAAEPSHWLRGPWPLVFGAVGLAALNFATLLVAGHPWSITWAFALWGAKAAMALGWSPAGDPFWSAAFQREALAASIFDDVTSVMNIGLVIGALAAAGTAGRFAPSLRVSRGAWLAAALGGLAMGYGARIAFGCNVGAFFSGIASTSLHGWLWIAAALPGARIGVWLRPRFGLRD